MFSAFLKVLCPQKTIKKAKEKISSSWGRAQTFVLENKQSFHLLISDQTLLSTDLKSPVDNASQQILSYECHGMFKIGDSLLYESAKIYYAIIFPSWYFSLCLFCASSSDWVPVISGTNLYKNRSALLVPLTAAVAGNPEHSIASQ